jgi:isopenicillin-N epimerase
VTHPLRAQFLLDAEVVFLDHGCYGACPRVVFERYQGWQAELERRPVEFLGRRLEGLLAEARADFAAYVGAAADDLVFVENTTAGVNVAARALALGPGDEVLSTDLEYGALNYMWERLCAQTGARFVRAPVRLPTSGQDEIAENVWAHAGPRTKAIFVSHLTSATALVLPAAELCRRAREAGVVSIVDGAHVPGHLPLDLASFGADIYVGNCHKWLCAPKGSAFLWVRPELQESIGALAVGWGFGEGSTFLTRNERQGTRDPAAYLTVPEAIRWQEERGWDEVRARCHGLALAARERLAALTGLEPLAPPELLGQMASSPLPAGLDADALKARLYDEFRIEVPVLVRGDERFVRPSFQGYNDADDLDALVAALEQLLLG